MGTSKPKRKYRGKHQRKRNPKKPGHWLYPTSLQVLDTMCEIALYQDKQLVEVFDDHMQGLDDCAVTTEQMFHQGLKETFCPSSN